MFSDRVKKMRNEKGFTQLELGALLGVKKQTVTNWEAGNNYPNFETLVKLTGLLGVTTDYLLGLYDENKQYASTVAATTKDRQSQKAAELYQKMLDAGLTEEKIETFIDITVSLVKKPPK